MKITKSKQTYLDNFNMDPLEVLNWFKRQIEIETGFSDTAIKQCFLFEQERREDIIIFKVSDLINPNKSNNGCIIDYSTVCYLQGTKEEFSELKNLFSK